MGPPLNRLLPIAGQFEKRLATLRIIGLLSESSALVRLVLPRLGPLLEDPMYRRMRKALIREIAPVTVLDWVEAEEYVLSQYQSMRFRSFSAALDRVVDHTEVETVTSDLTGNGTKRSLVLDELQHRGVSLSFERVLRTCHPGATTEDRLIARQLDSALDAQVRCGPQLIAVARVDRWPVRAVSRHPADEVMDEAHGRRSSPLGRTGERIP